MEPKAKHILLVEDDTFTQKVIKHILKDYNFICAKSEKEMYKQLKQIAQIDLIIMDIGLKGSKNGLDIIRELRLVDQYKKIPIIVITSYDNRFQESSAIEAGAQYYITKPLKKEELQRAVSESIFKSTVKPQQS